MSAVDLFRRAWAELRPHLLGWILFYTAFTVLALGTCGLAGLLLPNTLRELRDARREARGPRISRLFDLSHLQNDLLNYLVFYGAVLVGGAAAGIGSSLAALALQQQMPLAAEDRFAPLDNARLSLQHVLAHPAQHLGYLLISTALVLASMALCFLPLPLVAPLIGMAHWLLYEESVGELDELARQAGIRPLTTT